MPNSIFLKRAAMLGLSAVLMTSLPAKAQEVTVLKTSVSFQTIDVIFYKPAGNGPFPLLVMSHGSPRSPSARARFGVNTLQAQASAYAKQGVAVAVPIRRGYGNNGGWAEGYGRCENADYYSAGLASAADIKAAADIAKTQPGVDGSRVALMGVSAGGWGSVAAASYGGFMGVVNFAGGRGSQGPNSVCNEDNLVKSAASLVSSAPQLWVYSKNDLFFGPELAQRMHTSFNSAGGKAQFVAAPPYGSDGHAYFNAVGSWQPTADRFLRSIGFMR
jgi:dienelactone hydrolase